VRILSKKNYYVFYGVKEVPLVNLSIFELIASMFAFGMAFGVAIAIAILFVVQVSLLKKKLNIDLLQTKRKRRKILDSNYPQKHNRYRELDCQESRP
jgi:hypothetical protein